MRRCAREASRSRATAAIDGSASPRNPSELTAARSSRLAILLVAWRVSASAQFVGRNAAAVVAHRGSGSAPPLLHLDLDAGSAGIQRILDQFLDDGRRALHHLAGGDLVDEMGRAVRVWAWRQSYRLTSLEQRQGPVLPAITGVSPGCMRCLANRVPSGGLVRKCSRTPLKMASAMAAWCTGSLSFLSSAGLEM